MPDLTGETIYHYKIIEKLGGGGMGVVYRAIDLKLDRFIALKFLPGELVSDSSSVDRFIMEAKSISALQHNNICTIHDIGETESGQFFICMDYYEGETLKVKLSRNKLTIQDSTEIAIQILKGLVKAHSKGIVHRDIKPANIFYTNDNIVKILDFGLAKVKGKTHITKLGTTMGTLAYMSPEQIIGQEIDQRTDLWSFGVVYYEMLTGSLPFNSEHELAIIYSIKNENPISNPELKKLPALLIRILEKALSKNKELRYHYAQEIIDDLIAFSEQPNRVSNKKNDEKISIAVLPFTDLSKEKDQEYFCEGLADDIMNELANIPQLKVLGRTSAFAFHSVPTDISIIGRRLGASYILDGSVRKSSNRLRITVQLIQVSDGFQVWSDRYDRESKDIFKIQDEITKSISDHLKIQLQDKSEIKVYKRQSANLAAYNYFLKGRYFWNRRYEGGILKSLDYYQQAIEEDPTYALAYAGLADSYSVLGFWGFWAPWDSIPKSVQAAEYALKINPKLPEAYASLGGLSSVALNFNKSEEYFKTAIKLDPNYAISHEWYAVLFLVAKGRYEEAIEKNKLAEILDPLSLIIGCMSGLIYLFAGKYDDSIKKLNSILEMDSNFVLAKLVLGIAYSEINETSKAINELETIKKLSDSSAISISFLGYAYGKANNKKLAFEMLNELENKKYYSNFFKAVIFAGLKNGEQVLKFLECAADQKEPMRLWFKAWPMFNFLESNKRYNTLMKNLGL